jgi:DNA-binding NarL/FixJ family response regulator
MERPIRVLLADDHPALRVGLRVLLDRAPDIQVIGEANDGETALRMIESLLPDVAVLDCQLPEMNGVALTSALRQSRSYVRVLALSAYDDDRYLAGMMDAGALGYLLKNEAPDQIVGAVRATAEGKALWTRDQRARVRRWRATVAEVRDRLTPREGEVLRLVAAGLSNKEIAQALAVTVRTVEFHVGNLLKKLNVVSRVEAAVWAKEQGLDANPPSEED